MELFLLQVFALLRPVLAIEVEQKIAGMSLFDIGAIMLLGMVTFAFCVHITAGRRDVTLRSVDAWMIAYIVWCVAVSLIYPDKADLREVVKWTTPFITYLVAAKILRDRRDYLRVLAFLLAGHVLPVVASAVVIFLDLDWAIRKIVGATDLPKFEGVYANSGNLGLGMVLLVIAGVVYVAVARGLRGDGKALTRGQIVLFAVIGALTLYCLLKSQSRTAQIGLLLFGATYLYQVSKKWLVIGAVVLSASIVILSPLLKLMYYDVIEVHQGERPVEELGSNRPVTWMHNLSEFSEVSIDRQLAGVGIGNLVGMGDFARDGGESFWSSHNDFLSVFIHTGVVGLAIFLGLQLAILRKILAIEGRERPVFIALFVAVTAMNFASNSYVSRYALAQMYLLVLAYLEFVPVKSAARAWQARVASRTTGRTGAAPGVTAGRPAP